MTNMLLRVILPEPPEGEKLKKPRIVKIGKGDAAEWAMVVEVNEWFAWHQPVNGGGYLLDVRAVQA